ncbi:MAG: MBOAT family protein [Neisseria sp.]|nr:MBOAT family protein [Neisseria sp.]
MPFLSIEFAFAFLIFFLLYWLCAPKPALQNGLLLFAGLGLLAYVSVPAMLTVVAFSLLTSCIAVGLSHSSRQGVRKTWLAAGIVAALANLSFFKYYDFFRPALQQYLGGEAADILMPLGVSYYTFQAIAYLVSLYRRGDVRLRWYDLLLHFSFFPTITSGPIIRAGSFKSAVGVQQGISSQIQTTSRRSIIRPALAVGLILLGVSKKWWLAGTLADGWVDPVFENPMQYDIVAVLTAMYGYTAQLFLDFSGYSDLVIGLAMLLGFQLPQNFNMPLRAFNIRDFWDRWHITLSTWIRDYIYIPLGGSRGGFTRTQINLLIAMVLSGIWHGSGWNFLLWGLLHGVALVLLNIGDKIVGRREALASTKIGKFIGVLVTVNFVCAAFVVFRTTSLDDAALMFQALWYNPNPAALPALDVLAVLALMVLSLLFYGLLTKGFRGFVAMLEKMPVWLWALPVAAVMVLLMVLAPSGIPGFIYANF